MTDPTPDTPLFPARDGLCQFRAAGGGTAIGFVRDGRIFDVTGPMPAFGSSLQAVITLGPDRLKEVMAAGASLAEAGGTGIALDDAHVLAPIAAPPKCLCMGLNFRDHAAETGIPVPDFPIVFTRFPSGFAAHGQPIVVPKASYKLDYEAELVAVIGIGGRHIAEDRALDHVIAYSLFNDGSVRDVQKRGQQWTLGKNFDATGGFGPLLVPAWDLPRGGAGLGIRCVVNGQVLQDGNTADMIFDVARAIAMISDVMTLEAGDCLVMGTPAGVGFTRKPPIYLKPGDICEVTIDGLGVLRNPVVAEAA